MEQPIQHIVVGFDFSDSAVRAADVTVEIGRRFDADVHIVTATAGHIAGHIDERILLAAELEALHRRDELYPDEGILEPCPGRCTPCSRERR